MCCSLCFGSVLSEFFRRGGSYIRQTSSRGSHNWVKAAAIAIAIATLGIACIDHNTCFAVFKIIESNVGTSPPIYQTYPLRQKIAEPFSQRACQWSENNKANRDNSFIAGWCDTK